MYDFLSSDAIHSFVLTFARMLQMSKSTRKVAHDILRTSDGFE